MRNIYILFLASNDLGVRRLVMPAGPLIVASAIRRSPLFGRNDRVFICDTFREVRELAGRFAGDRVHFLVSSMQIIRGVNNETNPALTYLKRLKTHFPDIVSCVGGPDVSLNLDDYRAAFDIVFQGEIGCLDPIEILRSGTPCVKAPTADINAEPLDYGLLAGRTYLSGSIQTTRGCPHACDFCNISHIYGGGIRTISPVLLEERLESLSRVHRGFVIIGDDNFGGGVEEKMSALLEIIVRFQERRDYPFLFAVQTPLRTARFPEILGLMRAAHVGAAFIGVESPSEDALKAAHKGHNLGAPLSEQIDAFSQHGILPYISLILGMDHEPGDIPDRIMAFLETCRTPFLMLNLINPVAGSKFRARTQVEGRLLDHPLYLRHNLISLKTGRPYIQVIRDYVEILSWFYAGGRLIESCRWIEQRANSGRNSRALESFASGFSVFAVIKLFAVCVGIFLRSGSAAGLLDLMKLIGRPKAEILFSLAIRGTAFGSKGARKAEVRTITRGMTKLRAAGLYPYDKESKSEIQPPAQKSDYRSEREALARF